MKNKRLLWLIPLFIGLIPFIWALIGGCWAAIDGFSGLSFLGPRYYGFTAFADWIILFSYVAWPIYLVGLALILPSVVMLLRKPKA
jgi:hypothetical protein